MMKVFDERLNVKLLKRVRKHVLAEPGRLNMWAWLVKEVSKTCGIKKLPTPNPNNPKPLFQLKVGKCDTVGCIAGWVVFLGDPPEHSTPVGMISMRAAELLGIPLGKAEGLFWPHRWAPEMLTKLKKTRPGTKAHAEVVVEALDLWMRDGQVGEYPVL